MIVVAIYAWLRFGQEVAAFFKEHSTATAAITVANLQSELVQKQNIIQSLQHEVQQQNAIKLANWQPITIEHLIRMADLTLNTTGDVKVALAFLLAAKKYAIDFGELTVIRALNKDITNLQAVPFVNVEELVLKIDAANQQVNILPTMPLQPAVVSTATEIREPQYLHSVKQFLLSVGKALKDIVIIRRQVVEPILLPEQTTILRLNIQTKLLQAELAAMQRQNKIYQACLAQVKDWITKYFTLHSQETANILQALQELQRVDLHPNLPSLTGSFTAIQEVTKTITQSTTLQTEQAKPL